MRLINISMQQRIQDFLDEEAPTSKGAPTYYSTKFRRKLHENEENWTEGREFKFLLCRYSSPKF